MTEEQIAMLKAMDLPYCPSAFIYCKENFNKYLGYIKLRAFRVFGWEGSALLEANQSENWLKMAKYRKETD